MSTPSFDDRLAAALASDIPHHYANGFVASASSCDMVVAFEQNGTPAFTLNLSYTAAKTLLVALGSQIAQVEDAMGQSVLTSDVLERGRSAATKGSKS